MNLAATIKNYIRQYADWQQNVPVGQPTIRAKWFEQLTPALDRHNDYIDFLVKPRPNSWLVTDGAATLDDLHVCGFPVDSEKRKRMLAQILDRYDVSLANDDQLTVTAAKAMLGPSKHRLLQAILTINDCMDTRDPADTMFFFESVAAWLEAKHIDTEPHPTFLGRSHLEQHFDFLIRKGEHSDDRVIKIINNVDETLIANAVYLWADMRAGRKLPAKAFFIVNDEGVLSLEEVTDAVKAYDVTLIPWSKRDDLSHLLVD